MTFAQVVTDVCTDTEAIRIINLVLNSLQTVAVAVVWSRYGHRTASQGGTDPSPFDRSR